MPRCHEQSLLDEMGADKDCTALNPQGDLVVARPEAVYFYSVDGRGPCFVFEGLRFYGASACERPTLSQCIGVICSARGLTDTHMTMILKGYLMYK